MLLFIVLFASGTDDSFLSFNVLMYELLDRSNLSVCVQKFPTDKAYFIAKELLTTERTYLKDLQAITEVRIPEHFGVF